MIHTGIPARTFSGIYYVGKEANTMEPVKTEMNRAERERIVRTAAAENRLEGLNSTPRLKALDDDFINGRISFEEYQETILSWHRGDGDHAESLP